MHCFGVYLFRHGQLTATTASLPYWSRIKGYYSIDPSEETPFQVSSFVLDTS